jgi:hypothetical protein
MFTSTNVGTTAATLIVVSAIVEAIVEYLIRPLVKPWLDDAGADAPDPDDHAGLNGPGRVSWRGVVLRYTATVVGLAICLAYDLDLAASLGLETPIPFVGNVITGLLVGRGSNFLNDFADRWLGEAG